MHGSPRASKGETIPRLVLRVVSALQKFEFLLEYGQIFLEILDSLQQLPELLLRA